MEISDPSKLKVPQAKSATTSMSSIMDAYKSQSKIQLFDESTAMSSSGMEGAKAKNIPLSALRPSQAVESVDENGNKIVLNKSQYAEELDKRNDIRKAYMQMNGVSEDTTSSITAANKEVEYIEDVPEDTEGILNYIKTCIKNQETNLEMLKALYAALS